MMSDPWQQAVDNYLKVNEVADDVTIVVHGVDILGEIVLRGVGIENLDRIEANEIQAAINAATTSHEVAQPPVEVDTEPCGSQKRNRHPRRNRERQTSIAFHNRRLRQRRGRR